MDRNVIYEATGAGKGFYCFVNLCYDFLPKHEKLALHIIER